MDKVWGPVIALEPCQDIPINRPEDRQSYVWCVITTQCIHCHITTVLLSVQWCKKHKWLRIWKNILSPCDSERIGYCSGRWRSSIILRSPFFSCLESFVNLLAFTIQSTTATEHSLTIWLLLSQILSTQTTEFIECAFLPSHAYYSHSIYHKKSGDPTCIYFRIRSNALLSDCTTIE